MLTGRYIFMLVLTRYGSVCLAKSNLWAFTNVSCLLEGQFLAIVEQKMAEWISICGQQLQSWTIQLKHPSSDLNFQFVIPWKMCFHSSTSWAFAFWYEVLAIHVYSTRFVIVHYFEAVPWTFQFVIFKNCDSFLTCTDEHHLILCVFHVLNGIGTFLTC